MVMRAAERAVFPVLEHIVEASRVENNGHRRGFCHEFWIDNMKSSEGPVGTLELRVEALNDHVIPDQVGVFIWDKGVLELRHIGGKLETSR